MLSICCMISSQSCDNRPRRRRISSTNCVKFLWRRSRRVTSHAAVEFFPRRRRRILSPVFRRNQSINRLVLFWLMFYYFSQNPNWVHYIVILFLAGPVTCKGATCFCTTGLIEVNRSGHQRTKTNDCAVMAWPWRVWRHYQIVCAYLQRILNTDMIRWCYFVICIHAYNSGLTKTAAGADRPCVSSAVLYGCSANCDCAVCVLWVTNVTLDSNSFTPVL